MAEALFLNGVYKDTLDEIIDLQRIDPTKYGYLQPYSSKRIKLLSETTRPTSAHPITLYLSLTSSLGLVSYSAEIVEWRDKTSIDLAERENMTKLLKANQPSETDGIYHQINGKDCKNLIAVRGLKTIKPFPVGNLIKTSDGTKLRAKQTSGGWAVVHELTESPFA